MDFEAFNLSWREALIAIIVLLAFYVVVLYMRIRRLQHAALGQRAHRVQVGAVHRVRVIRRIDPARLDQSAADLRVERLGLQPEPLHHLLRRQPVGHRKID